MKNKDMECSYSLEELKQMMLSTSNMDLKMWLIKIISEHSEDDGKEVYFSFSSSEF